jgi:hypothetical protein
VALLGEEDLGSCAILGLGEGDHSAGGGRYLLGLRCVLVDMAEAVQPGAQIGGDVLLAGGVDAGDEILDGLDEGLFHACGHAAPEFQHLFAVFHLEKDGKEGLCIGAVLDLCT